MKKISRSKREAYNQGRHDGYMEGYAKGLYDGNPFNTMVEALSSLANTISEAIKENPDLLKEMKEMETLDIEGFDEE